MPITNQADLISTLEAGDFTRIIGTPECHWLDFKQKAYDGQSGKPTRLSQKGRYELCKDVAAFANDRGGVILLGVTEQLSTASGRSVAGRLTPIKTSAVDLAHYRRLLMDFIYPLVVGVEMQWYLTDKTANVGLLAIIVPGRKGEGKHIVKDAMDENGNGLHGLTIPERTDDQTYIYPAEALYELIRKIDGAKLSTSGGFSSIQSGVTDAINKHLQKVEQESKRAEKIGQTIRDDFIGSLDWNELPIMTLQALPIAGPSRLNSFYDEVKDAFRSTKPVRGMGFNLNSFGLETATEDGAFIKSGVRGAALRLDPNGTLTMLIRGDDNLLGWAMSRDWRGNEIRINAIVLIEVVFEFVRFVCETLASYGLEKWEYVLDIRRFKDYHLALYEGGPNSMSAHDPKEASKNKRVEVISKSDDYTKDVFKILAEVYALFSLPEKAIPYISDGAVTLDNIRDLNKNINGF